MQNLYRHFNKNNNLLYIGVSLNVLSRLYQHKLNTHWFSEITLVTIQSFDTREEALEAEKDAIAKEKPLYNIKFQPPQKESEEINIIMPNLPRLLSVKETAKYLGISTRTIYNQTSSKAKKKFPIKPIKISGLIKFDRKDIDEWIECVKR